MHSVQIYAAKYQRTSGFHFHGWLRSICHAAAAVLQSDLQQELVARGLEQQGKKEELASRLLDSLIAQVGACSACASSAA
jgi:hypothetical protein